ncbi:MAG: HAD family hydrolase [Planctomycetota bacterium]
MLAIPTGAIHRAHAGNFAMRRYIPFALVYDFDGTLAPGNMQERDFIPAIGMTKKKFWQEVEEESKKHTADNILMYMRLMLRKADSAEVQVRKADFRDYGRQIKFFNGVLATKDGTTTKKGWFNRINEYGKQSGVAIEHYIVSSGIREMVTGTPIAKKFKAVFASSFCYDHHGVATWPALALNYTTKTQYIFRINKGCLDVYEHEELNKFVSDHERPIPFRQMIYIGDGTTDIPCFRLVKDRGGYSVAVYKPRTGDARKNALKLVKDGRVNFVAPADYSDGSELDRIVKGIIDKVTADRYVEKLHP